MTEIKTWGDRLAEIPDGTITTSYHVTGAMQDEIDELRARLAQQAEMVEKCMVAMNENADRGMKAEQERDELRAALSKSKAELDEWRFTNKIDEMQREIERLSAHVAKVEQGKPVRPMSYEQISLMAHNEDSGDWMSLRLRDSWHEGYVKGFRAAEAHIKGATE